MRGSSWSRKPSTPRSWTGRRPSSARSRCSWAVNGPPPRSVCADTQRRIGGRLLPRLCNEIVLSLLHLGGGEVLEVLGDDPLVAPAVVDFADAVAPEHVAGRHGHYEARILGEMERLVDVP